jgi:hypothetical protein
MPNTQLTYDRSVLESTKAIANAPHAWREVDTGAAMRAPCAASAPINADAMTSVRRLTSIGQRQNPSGWRCRGERVAVHAQHQERAMRS